MAFSMTREDYESDALSTMTNFIAQEIYRLAVIRQYPDDYSRICRLSRCVENRLAPLRDSVFDSVIDNLAARAVNLIVWGAEAEEFHQQIGEILNSNNDHDDANEAAELIASALTLLNTVFREHEAFPCAIPHQYPPALLSTCFDYFAALDYYHGLAFYPQPNAARNQVTVISAPYFALRPYSKNTVHQSREIIQRIPVPATALASQKGGTRVIEADVPDLFESWIELDFMNPVDEIDYTTELRFRVDMAEPLSDIQVDKLLAQFRLALAAAQRHNRAARMLLAENEAALVEAYRIPRLQTVEYNTLKALYKAELPGLNTSQNAKDYLCGLIIYHQQYVKVRGSDEDITVSWENNADGQTLLTRASHVSAQLSDKYGERGFSAPTLSKGVKLVSKVFHRYLDEFQAGRVQFTVRLNGDQQRKLEQQPSVPDERLHPDDIKQVNEIIARRRKQGRHAQVKQRANGSFVIIG